MQAPAELSHLTKLTRLGIFQFQGPAADLRPLVLPQVGVTEHWRRPVAEPFAVCNPMAWLHTERDPATICMPGSGEQARHKGHAAD